MNNVSLIGRVGNDIELKTTQNGISVCDFSLAVKKGDKTIWLRIVAWRGTAELAAKYVKKGDLIGITGELDSRTYEKNEEKRTIVEVIANSLHFCSNKKEQDSAPVEEFDNDLPF